MLERQRLAHIRFHEVESGRIQAELLPVSLPHLHMPTTTLKLTIKPNCGARCVSQKSIRINLLIF